MILSQCCAKGSLFPGEGLLWGGGFAFSVGNLGFRFLELWNPESRSLHLNLANVKAQKVWLRFLGEVASCLSLGAELAGWMKRVCWISAGAFVSGFFVCGHLVSIVSNCFQIACHGKQLAKKEEEIPGGAISLQHQKEHKISSLFEVVASVASVAWRVFSVVGVLTASSAFVVPATVFAGISVSVSLCCSLRDFLMGSAHGKECEEGYL